jgi:hypothetical protein
MLANDFAHCSEPQATAIQTRGKKSGSKLRSSVTLSVPRQGVADDNAHIAAGHTMSERPSPLCRSLIYPIAATLLLNPYVNWR